MLIFVLKILVLRVEPKEWTVNRSGAELPMTFVLITLSAGLAVYLMKKTPRSQFEKHGCLMVFRCVILKRLDLHWQVLVHNQRAASLGLA